MNILEAEDIVKGLPDDALMQYSEYPTGQIPEFLVFSEIQRRTDMRNRYAQQMQEQPQGTVADQIKQQGIMSMMPQGGMGPQGMPPQMAMPPMGMPPQMMAGGGIVKLANGGQPEKMQSLMDILAVGGVTTADLVAQGYTLGEIQTAQAQLRERMSMPVTGMDRVMPSGKASDPVRRTELGYGDQYDTPFIPGVTDVISRKVSEGVDAAGRGIESFSIEAQKQMPNYSMIAPAGMDIAYGDVADAISSAVAQTPIARHGAEARQRIQDVYDESGTGAAFGQSIREVPGRLAAFAETAIGGYAPLGEGARMAAASPIINEPARALEQLVTGSVSENPLTLGGIGERLGSSLYDMFNDRYDPNASTEPDPVADLVSATQNVSGVDKSNPTAPPTSQNIGGSERQGAGTEVQSEAGITDSLLRSVMADEPPREMPDLSIADLIADQRRMTQANMLMQLGAGIAGGDLSKGLSAAGMAGMKGSQAEQALALKERLAKYQAGREDIARAEKGKQFERTFGLSEKKLDAMLQQNEDTTKRELLRTLVAQFEAELDQVKRAQYASQIQQIIDELRGEPMVVGGMQGARSGQPLSSFER
jgi:hypothetical protein